MEETWDLARQKGVSFNHVNRSANSVADMLAKVGVGHPSLITFHDPDHLL